MYLILYLMYELQSTDVARCACKVDGRRTLTMVSVPLQSRIFLLFSGNPLASLVRSRLRLAQEGPLLGSEQKRPRIYFVVLLPVQCPVLPAATDGGDGTDSDVIHDVDSYGSLDLHTPKRVLGPLPSWGKCL